MSSSVSSGAKLPHGSSPRLLTANLAKERLRALQAAQPSTEAEPAKPPLAVELRELPIVELIPRLRPGSEQPLHLQPLTDELELCIAPHEGQRFFWFSVPPRHWKTTTLRNAIVKHLLCWPEEGVAYCTHTQ